MEPVNIATTKTPNTNKEESSSGSKKAASSSSSQRQQDQQQQQALKCPRCDSMNTKFCYYNNYSLTQPRHFCKTCRRYWTRGGALRNVPVGGGCRKSKKLKSSSLNLSGDSPTSDISRLNFFNGFSSSTSHPTLDFQLGGHSIP
ncbi:hypothetical protein Leryth_027469 [Lithospermum erythrorhizon]|nr:hypothetical protein Leryth_027469 [Lithospermum erythrorhizon]